MSLSRIESGSSALSHRSNPPPGELNLGTSIARSDQPADDVKTDADAELAALLADKHQDDWRFQDLSPQTSIGKWRGHFVNAWNSPSMQAWISAQNFGIYSLHIVGSTLTITAFRSGKVTTYTPSDGSGWWPAGRQVIASAAILDPQGKGLNDALTKPLPSEIAAFYGVRWPITRTDAATLKTKGFPLIPVEEDPLRSREMRKLAEREFMDVENENAWIKTLLSQIKDKPDDEDIDLRAISQVIDPRSSLAIANRSGLKILKALMRDPLMAPILSANHADRNARIRLENGQLLVRANGAPGSWRNVTEQVLADPALAQRLNSAIEHSQATGKIIRSQSITDLWQLLRFATSSDLPAINTVSELRNLLNWKLNPLPPEHQQLEVMHSAGPIYDWALAQGVVTEEDDYSSMAQITALNTYNERVQDSGLMAASLDEARSSLKTRMEAGEQELERVCPGQSEFFNKRTVWFTPKSLLVNALPSSNLADALARLWRGPNTTALGLVSGPCSIKDLYLSGVLTAENINTQDLNFVNPLDKAAFEALKRQLVKLKPIQAVFDVPFMLGLNNLENFQVIAAKMLLSELPVEDRRRLEFGEVTVYGASTQEGDLSQEEAQQKIGPILFLRDGLGAKCYELDPTTHRYVERPELVDAMTFMSDSGTRSFGRIMRRRLNPTLPVDIDVKAHFPAKSKRQGASAGLPNTYASTRTTEVLRVLQLGNLLVDPQLLTKQAAGTTYNEAVQQRLDAIDNFVINTLIPFKGNIEEIASGDRRRVALGAIGLGLEIVGALVVVATAVAGVAKAASIATRFASVGKAVVSMFNLPGAVAGTAKSLFRLTAMGVRSMGVNVPKTVSKGLADFSRLVRGGKNAQKLFRLSPRERMGKEVNNLMGNIALPNTIRGTGDFAEQSPPQVTKGSNSLAI